MNIQDLKQQFHSGAIGKPEYIAQALDIHRRLFDYIGITQSTDVREIVISPDGVSFVVGDEAVRLFSPPEEARVAPIEVMNFDRYEPDETRVMDLLTQDATTVLDVGANIGWYAVRFAKRLPQARVYAFEPLPTTYRYLQRNIAANGVGQRVSSFNYGLSETSGTVNFFISPTSGTNASRLNVAAAQDARAVVGLTLTLDAWVQNEQVAPDFIKCDVEGAELLVFRGGSETLRRHRPIVCAELLRKWSRPFGYHPNDMLGYFAAFGYDCYAVGAAGVRLLREVSDSTPETNYAFVHREQHSDAIARLQALGSQPR